MKSTFSFFGRDFSKRRASGRKSARRTRQFSFENLEGRRLMTVNPLLGAAYGPTPPAVFSQPTSEGTITFNSSTGKITATGSATRAEHISITLDNRGTASTADDVVTVSIYNGGLPVQLSVKPSLLKEVDISFGSGDNLVDNQTSVSMNVHAGNGNNTILGGSGDDYLMGGNGNDYIDGRGGDDMIYGMGGNDVLFGDDGDDTLLGGNGDDVLFGGNGVDHLYGEAGNDHLYGGAGTDALTDPSGTNTLYTDYGPDGVVSNSGYQSFDFFDRYLKDPTVRSQARLDYNDGVLDRAEMLRLYTTIETDNLVSGNEFSDLKNLVSTKLVMPNDSRFFATKVADGDTANAHYQGATLGNLKAGSTGVQLDELVGKWFEGNDLPSLAGADEGAGTSYELAYGQLFQHPVTYTDVAQGFTGNCGFLSALASVAKASPQTINNMFVDNGDGTYTVRFFNNGTPQYVTVNRMLPAEAAGTNAFAGWSGVDSSGQYDRFARLDNPTNTLWVALAEKAYAQLNESGWTGLDGTNTYLAFNAGIYPDKAAAQITGYSAVVHKLSSSSTLTDLIASLGAGKAITITSNTKLADSNQVVADHAYVVADYDASTQMFTLYNPWGYENTSAVIHPTILHLTQADMTKAFASWAEDRVN